MSLDHDKPTRALCWRWLKF